MRLLPAFVALLFGCAKYSPPPAAPPRDATVVAASAGQTWDAVIDLFAARNIPIRTIERVSGLIVTDNLSVGEEGVFWADCGKIKGVAAPKREEGMPTYVGPNRATYNVLVRGDSASAKVKATVRWSRLLRDVDVRECSTTHLWEREFEEEIKQHAERQRVAGQRPDAPVVLSESTATEDKAEQSASPRTADGERESALQRKAREAEEARWKARLPRGNAQLLLEQEFSLAVADCTRLGFIQSYGETARDTLVVILTDQAMVTPGTEYSLARLFRGYLRTTGNSPASVLELRHSGRVVGEYTGNGLSRTDWR